MKKRSGEYWKDRFLNIEKASNAYGVEAFRQIEPAFDEAQRAIQREIERWYSRYAKNNQISITEARKALTAKELKELRWDVNEYIKKGRENAFNGKWVKELENASARVHISRLEALKIRTQQAAEVAFGNELDVIDDMARKVYTEDYYRSIYEMQKGFNIGWDIGTIDQKKLDKLIVKPWTADNKTFSDRIWQTKNQMVSELHNQLTRTCVLGKSPDKAIEALIKYVDKDIENKKYVAGRLVMTEQAYFHSVAQKDAFNDLDVEEFEIVATLDSHTSQICQDLDGTHLPMSQYEPGVTAPPFHVFCRSVVVPYFEDNFTGERAARDAEGNTYYVPDNMTYKEWASKYISNEADFKNVKEKIKNKVDILTRERPPKSLSDIVSENQSIKSAIDNAPDPFKRIMMSKSQDIKFAKTNAIGHQRYNSKYGIFVNLDEDFVNTRGQWTTLFHEVGHNIDEIYGKLSKNSALANLLKNDFDDLTRKFSSRYNIGIDETYDKISDILKQGSDEESHIMSDLFDALSGGKCKGYYRHSKSYWKSDAIIANEAFAHFFSASVLNNEVKLADIKQVFPNAYDEFLRLVSDIK